MRKSEREAVVAHHEAGHAVIARKLGLEVIRVTLSLHNSGAAYYRRGATYLARNADLATQISAAETDAIISLAGPTAEWQPRCSHRECQRLRLCHGWPSAGVATGNPV
jgi:hypothetical protein